MFFGYFLAFLENLIITGAVTNEVEVDPLNPHYLTSAQYLGKDHIVVGGTDRSIIKIIDKVIKGFSGWMQVQKKWALQFRTFISFSCDMIAESAMEA